MIDPSFDLVLRRALRSSLVLLALAIGLPAGCSALFERRARRLDALAEHGTPLSAVVSQTDDGWRASYDVARKSYAPSIDARDGERADDDGKLALIVLAEDPTVFFAGDRDGAARKASEARSFEMKLDLGLLWFFGFGAALGLWQYRRMKQTGVTERLDRDAYRIRLALSGVWIAPLLAAVFAYHWLEGRARGESAWPVILGIVLTMGILGETGWYVLREGRAKANERSRRLLRWAVPLAVAAASIRLVAWLVAGR